MKKLVPVLLAMLISLTAISQQNVGIGTATPNASALLELNSTSKGLLIPRMLSSNLPGIASPATGLLVYQTDAPAGFYYNSGMPVSPVWTLIGSAAISGWGLNGNAGTIPGTNFFGTTDNQPVFFRQNNFWMGKWDANLGNYFLGDSSGAKTSPSSSSNGRNNIAIGDSTLLNNTTGSFNISLGLRAMKLNTIGDGNFAAGHRVLYNNSAGYDNVAIGSEAMFSNINGGNNVAIGEEALRQNTGGLHNTGIGYRAAYNNTSGDENISIGYNSMFSTTTGSSNIALGRESLYSNDNGDDNIAAGFRALYANTSGEGNIAMGNKALDSNSTGIDNIALGKEALYTSTTGSNNVALGFNSMHSNRTGYGNVAAGFQGLTFNTTGHSNIALGSQAMRFNSTGQFNIGIGYLALSDNTTGNYNCAIGYLAAVGFNTQINSTAIGAYANVDVSNAIVLGSINGTNNATADTYVGIGTAAPKNKLHVVNNRQFDGWTDGIMIENSFASPGEAALSFRNKAMPSTRQWNIGLNENPVLAFNYGSAFNSSNTRLVIDTLGNVGIGVLVPTAKLDVNGAANINGSITGNGDITIPGSADFAYSTAKAHSLNIPHAAFQLIPVNGTSTAGIATTSISNGLWVNGGTSGVDAIYDAPVILPGGAVITAITMYVRDASGAFEVNAEFVEISGFVHSVLATLPGTGVAATPGDSFILLGSLSIPVSNNKSYYLRFNTKENNGNLRIYNARISYTVTNAD